MFLNEGVPETKKPPREPGGRKETMRLALALKRVGAFPALAFGRFNVEPHLLAQRRADEPSNRMRLPLGRLHDLLHGGSARALQQLQDLCGLAALPDGGLVGLLSAFRRFLGRAGLLARLTLAGRNVGYLWASAGLFGSFWGGCLVYGLALLDLFCVRCHHFVSSWRGDHRGHDIDHSEQPQRQAHSAEMDEENHGQLALGGI